MGILIKNGQIVDGTGAPAFLGDVLIEGDRILKIAPNIALEEDGVEVVDASGKWVIPGLIDPHVHEEWVCFVDGTYELFLRQGVTTVVNGNCGHSVVPGPMENIVDYYFGNGLFSLAQKEKYKQSFPQWQDFSSYRQAVMARGTNLNFVTLLGHGTIRWSVMNGAHPHRPSPKEAKAIEEIIRTNMDQGAWGLSFGLDYVPSRYADFDELVDVSKIIKEYDGVVAAHLRQSIGVKESTDEFIQVGQASGCKIQVSHLRPTCPEAFAAVQKARAEGVEVLVDTIPRSTGHCNSKSRLILFIMALSDELFSAGPEGVKAALKTPEGRAMIKEDAYIFAGDKSDKFIVRSDDSTIEGMSVEAIAKMRGVDPDECMLDLIGDENNYTFWLGGPVRQDFPKEGHLPSIVENPYVCVGSDEIMGDLEDPFDWYELQRRGSFPTFTQMYLGKGVAFEEIIRRNTTMVAEHFAIPWRGRLQEGYFADLAVIDLANYRFPNPEAIDYNQPLTTATGVDAVLVNGQFALKNGLLARPMAGRVLIKE